MTPGTLTWSEKIEAILSTHLLGREGERLALESLRRQIADGAEQNGIAWQWKALIDRRYQDTVVNRRRTA